MDMGQIKSAIEETKIDTSQTKPDLEEIDTKKGELKYKDGPHL